MGLKGSQKANVNHEIKYPTSTPRLGKCRNKPSFVSNRVVGKVRQTFVAKFDADFLSRIGQKQRILNAVTSSAYRGNGTNFIGEENETSRLPACATLTLGTWSAKHASSAAQS